MSWWTWDLRDPLSGHARYVIHMDRIAFVIFFALAMALVIRHGFF